MSLGERIAKTTGKAAINCPTCHGLELQLNKPDGFFHFYTCLNCLTPFRAANQLKVMDTSLLAQGSQAESGKGTQNEK